MLSTEGGHVPAQERGQSHNRLYLRFGMVFGPFRTCTAENTEICAGNPLHGGPAKKICEGPSQHEMPENSERRCRASMAHIRQSTPDFGLGRQVKVAETFQLVPSSLGSGRPTEAMGNHKYFARSRVSMSGRILCCHRTS